MTDRDRAEAQGHNRELWSRRPLAYWAKTPANKRLSMRLWRQQLKREARNETLQFLADEGQKWDLTGMNDATQNDPDLPWLRALADIREALGCGHKPMMSELAGLVRSVVEERDALRKIVDGK